MTENSGETTGSGEPRGSSPDGAVLPGLAEEEAALIAALAAAPDRGDLASRLCTVLAEQGKAVPAEWEELALRHALATQPDRGDLASRLCAVLAEQGKPVPAEWEELALRHALSTQPDRGDLASRLCAVLAEQSKVVPPDIEEMALHHALASQPDRGDLAQRLCAVLAGQGKAVPPDIEEMALRHALAEHEGRADLLGSLCSVLAKQGRPVPAELEERTLAAVLRDHPGRADIASRLAAVRLQRGLGLGQLDGPADWCLTTDPHTRDLEPFVFLHIPKTAGSVMRLLLLSLFDRDRLFPGWNFEDFDPEIIKAKLDPDRHRVFVGHMWWESVKGIADALGRMPHIFTVLREPVDHYRSQIAFVDRLAEQGITGTNVQGKDIEFVEFWDEERRLKHGVRLLNTQFVLVLGRDYDRLSYFIDRLRKPPGNRVPVAWEKLEERLDLIKVALFENLQHSMDLFCKQMVLPAQVIPRVRLNSSDADHSRGLSDEQKMIVEKGGSLAFRFYDEARQRFDAAYADAFSGIDDVAAHLNAAYRATVLEKMAPHWCVDLDSANAWPGYGWGYREENEHGQTWRRLTGNARGTVILRLHPGCDYIVVMTLHSCNDGEIEGAVTAEAGGERLTLGGVGFDDGRYMLNWRLPGEVVAHGGGAVDLVFSPTAPGIALDVAALTVYPVPA